MLNHAQKIELQELLKGIEVQEFHGLLPCARIFLSFHEGDYNIEAYLKVLIRPTYHDRQTTIRELLSFKLDITLHENLYIEGKNKFILSKEKEKQEAEKLKLKEFCNKLQSYLRQSDWTVMFTEEDGS